MDQVVSVFENDTTEIQYGYIENLNDGRGYTAGRAGFTTANGDLVDVVSDYLKLNPESPFQSLLGALKDAAKNHSSSVERLSALPGMWKHAAQDSRFRKVQDEVVDSYYLDPARDRAESLHITSYLGILCLYDAAIQHGEGNDPDSLDSMIKKLRNDYSNEEELLRDFLKIRHYVLLHPHDSRTKAEWKKSVGRVRALKKLVQDENFSLKGPFRIKPFGTSFEIR